VAGVGVRTTGIVLLSDSRSAQRDERNRVCFQYVCERWKVEGWDGREGVRNRWTRLVMGCVLNALFIPDSHAGLMIA
jgi:hypothetical protein